MYAKSFFEQNIIKNSLQIIIMIFFIHFLNSKLLFMFCYCRRHSIKKFDFNRQKKSKIKFRIDEIIDIISFQSSHRLYDFDKTFTFDEKSSSKFASFTIESVFKTSLKKK